MANFIVILVLVLITGLAARYIYKAKKSGRKCIGCPYSGSCGKNGASACSGDCCCGKQTD